MFAKSLCIWIHLVNFSDSICRQHNWKKHIMTAHLQLSLLPLHTKTRDHLNLTLWRPPHPSTRRVRSGASDAWRPGVGRRPPRRWASRDWRWRRRCEGETQECCRAARSAQKREREKKVVTRQLEFTRLLHKNRVHTHRVYIGSERRARALKRFPNRSQAAGSIGTVFCAGSVLVGWCFALRQCIFYHLLLLLPKLNFDTLQLLFKFTIARSINARARQGMKRCIDGLGIRCARGSIGRRVSGW